MLNFVYNIPTRIYFGKDQVHQIGEAVKEFGGSRVLITYGSKRIKNIGLFDEAVDYLKRYDIKVFELGGIEPNPRISSVREGVRICKENNVDFILSIGGGSVLDCSKAIAVGYYYDGDPWDFYIKKAELAEALPIGAILTLAATGSEMNGNSVISNLETEQKYSIGDDMLRPKFSILDPTLTYSVPSDQTAAGIVDIMSHIFEQYFSPIKDSFVQDRLAEALLQTCVYAGPIAMKEPDHYEARANLLWAGSLALNSLLTYGKYGDWATHMIEHEVSAIYDITHGVGLAILTPFWMEYVLDENTLDKFVSLALNVWKVHDSPIKMAVAKDGINRTRAFFSSLGMPERLRDVGIEKERLEEMAEKTVMFGSRGTIRTLEKDDVLKILEMAY